MKSYRAIESKMPEYLHTGHPKVMVFQSEITGKRGVRLPDGTIVPFGIAGMLGGKDKYVQDVEVRCETCKGWTKLRLMGERGEECEDCLEAELEAEQEAYARKTDPTEA